MDVEIRNFQSIAHVKLRIEGFVALVGRSNIGKSAVIRAVTAALSGASGTNFVRHGPSCLRRTKKAKTCKCYTSVHLQAPGLDLLWEKGDTVNRYTYNGTVYDRADRGTPEFLAPAFLPIPVGTEQVLLQTAPQTKPIFLLDETGGVVADVLADVANLDRINVAIRIADKERREATAKRKVRGQDLMALTARQESFQGLDGALAMVRAAEELHDRTERLRARLGTLVRLGDQFVRTDKDLARLQQVVHLPRLQTSQIQDAYARYVRLRTLSVRTRTVASSVQRLLPIQGVVALDLSRVKTQQERYRKLLGWLGALRGFKAAFQAMDLVAKGSTPDAQTLAVLRLKYRKLASWAARRASLQDALHRLEAQAQEQERQGEQLQQEWAELGVCPECSRPFHPKESC